MRLWICFLLAAGLMAAGSEKDKPAPAAEKAKRPVKKPVPPPLTVPPDAKQVEPGTWRQEAGGKVWIYRQTPFGIARSEEKAADREAGKPVDSGADMKAFDDGEYVRFERPGPFGTYKWQRKKTELNDTERQVWERSKGGRKE